MTVGRSLYRSTIQGVAIAMIFSFGILLFATQDITISLVALWCISLVILTVVCIMVLMGWELGTSESCGIVIAIGLSVDYVVHLAGDYAHSTPKLRSEKMNQAYRNMGVSIMSGSITTFGSALFLFGADLSLYRKFAIIISTTAAMSFVVSMVLFGAMCHAVGPEGEGYI